MKSISLLISAIMVPVLFFLPVHAAENSTQLAQCYMQLNGMEVEAHPGHYYQVLDLPMDSPITVIPVSDALLLENSYLYFGANWCPHCRNMIGVLMQAAADMNADALYASSAEEIKTLWELDEKNEPVCTREAGPEYRELLSWLSPVLRDYTLRDSNGNLHETGEKRIYMPCIIHIQDGQPVEQWSISTIEAFPISENSYAPWTDEQNLIAYASIVSFLSQ